MSAPIVRDESSPELAAIALAEQYYADWPAGLRTNMVMSLDGAVSFRGRVGPLSSPVDRRLFHALRALADVVLVGGATARAEKYGPAVFSERLTELRSRNHHAQAAPAPRMAIVTGSCELPERLLGLPAAQRPIVITSRNADTAPILDSAELVVAGTDSVDLSAAIGELQDRGMSRILCEGGPILLDGLTEADLVDELCVTLAPQLTAEAPPGVTSFSPLEQPRRYRLKHAVPRADDVFLRYVR